MDHIQKQEIDAGRVFSKNSQRKLDERTRSARIRDIRKTGMIGLAMILQGTKASFHQIDHMFDFDTVTKLPANL